MAVRFQDEVFWVVVLCDNQATEEPFHYSNYGGMQYDQKFGKL
jgi:hypothetical protein